MAHTVACGLAVACLVGPVFGHPSRSRAADVDILVIAHPGSAPAVVNRSELRAIFTTKQRHWSSGDMAIPLNFYTKNSLRVRFDRATLRLGPEQVGRFWVDRLIRGGDRAPRALGSERLMAKAVAKLKGAVGYLPASAPTRGVTIVARIINGQVVAPQ